MSFELPKEVRDNEELIEDEVLDFLHQNAVQNAENLEKSNEIISSKTTSLLGFVLTLVSFVLGYLFINYKTLDFATICGMLAFAIFNSISIICFLRVLNLKHFSPPYSEPVDYFNENKAYLLTIYDIKKWRLEHLQNTINHNHQRITERGNDLKYGLLFFASSLLIGFLFAFFYAICRIVVLS